MEAIDRGHRVNVDGVHVVDVVLHAAGHRGELGDHRQQQTEVVKVGEDAPRPCGARGAPRAAVLDQADEAARSLRRRAEPFAPPRIRRGRRERRAGRVGHRKVALHRQLDEAQRHRRVSLRRICRREACGPVEARHAVGQRLRATDVLRRSRRHAPGENVRKRRCDAARVAVVRRHQALRRGSHGLRRIRRVLRVVEEAQRLCAVLLHVEGQPIAAAPRPGVHRAAEAKVKFPRLPQRVVLALRQPAQPQGLGEIRRSEARAQRPSEDVEVPQTTAPELHVWLQQVDGLAEARVTLAKLAAQRLDERSELALAAERRRGLPEPVREAGVAGQKANVEHHRAGPHVVAGERHEPPDGLHRVPDAELRVPERVEQRLGELRHPTLARVVDDEHEVQVAARRQRAAAVATRREERRASLAGRREARVGVRDHEPVVGVRHGARWGGAA